MHDLISSLIIFIIVVLLRFIVYLLSKKKKNKRDGIMMEMQYLINRFKLDKTKINTNSIALLLSFIDAIIVSSSLFLSLKISNNTIVELLVAFILVFGLIILFNELIGRILKKKGYEKK